jgi:hypothetical protein
MQSLAMLDLKMFTWFFSWQASQESDAWMECWYLASGVSSATESVLQKPKADKIIIEWVRWKKVDDDILLRPQ